MDLLRILQVVLLLRECLHLTFCIVLLKNSSFLTFCGLWVVIPHTEKDWIRCALKLGALKIKLLMRRT